MKRKCVYTVEFKFDFLLRHKKSYGCVRSTPFDTDVHVANIWQVHLTKGGHLANNNGIFSAAFHILWRVYWPL